MPDEPIARIGYEQLADAYAAQVATKPHNAFYDRPALLALLPEVANRYVLDAGCGSGIYTEWLSEIMVPRFWHSMSAPRWSRMPRPVCTTAQRSARQI